MNATTVRPVDEKLPTPHMFGVLRMAMLLQRVAHSPSALAAREVLETAPGCSAATTSARWHRAWRSTSLPWRSTTSAWPVPIGRVVVRGGRLVSVDLPRLVERQRRLGRELLRA